MTVVKRSIVLWSAALAVLLAFSGVLLAVPPPNGNGAPTCPNQATGRNVQVYTNPNNASQVITVDTPGDHSICNTGGCCDKFYILGVPAGWTVRGWVESKYLFTCGGKDPEIIQRLDFDSNPITSTGAMITIDMCYPKTHAWPSFEIHIDLSLSIWDNSVTPVHQRWVGGDLVNAPGAIGPGLDWDPVCYTLGCTPGFWKNHCNSGCHQDLVWPGGYLPTTLFKTALGPLPAGKPNPSAGDTSLTLIGALNTGGGGEKAMVRHCAAALLNAGYVVSGSWPGSCLAFADGTPDIADIQSAVQAAYSSGNFEAAHQYCAGINESLCPNDDVWLGVAGPGCSGAPCNP